MTRQQIEPIRNRPATSHELLVRMTGLAALSLALLLVAIGCTPARNLQVTVLAKPRVDFGQKQVIKHLEIGRIEAQASGPQSGDADEAFRAALMGALAKRPQYHLVDESFRMLVQQGNLVRGTGVALADVDPAATVVLEARVHCELDERTEVRQEQLVLTTTQANGKATARPKPVPVYVRTVGGMAGVDVVLRTPDGKELKRQYGPVRSEARSQIGQGDVAGMGGGSKQRTAPALQEIKTELMRDLAARILEDLSPHEETYTFTFVDAGDPAGRFLVYHGGYGHAERTLLDKIENWSYPNPADKAADQYHLGLAYLGMGDPLTAKIFIERAATAGGHGAYRSALSTVERLLSERSEIQ